MEKQPRHRPERRFPEAQRVIVECELNECIHCGRPLMPRKPWHMKKTVQTLKGPVFVAGKSKACVNPECEGEDKYYYASGVLMVSLPYSTYGLDVLACIGWQHEHEHKQFIEIQRLLNGRGVQINERNVGKLYRQFLALLGGLSEKTRRQLESAAARHGGLVWATDALKPEGNGSLLYVLYEVLSRTPVSAIQTEHPTAQALDEWLKPYQALPYPVLATLSDGEEAILAAMKKGAWSRAPHQRCQAHWLSNIAEPALEYDTQLRKQLRDDLGGLPAVPDQAEAPSSRVRPEAEAGVFKIHRQAGPGVPGATAAEPNEVEPPVPSEPVRAAPLGQPATMVEGVGGGPSETAPPFCQFHGMLN